jgi:hypothetical protein
VASAYIDLKSLNSRCEGVKKRRKTQFILNMVKINNASSRNTARVIVRHGLSAIHYTVGLHIAEESTDRATMAPVVRTCSELLDMNSAEGAFESALVRVLAFVQPRAVGGIHESIRLFVVNSAHPHLLQKEGSVGRTGLKLVS